MNPTPNALPLPLAAERDPHATEMVRAWVAEGQLHCELKLGAWTKDGKVDEASAWGVVLADLVRQIATGLESITGEDRSAHLQRLTQSLSSALHHTNDE